MTVERRADPLVLERTVNRIIYGSGNGHGYNTSQGFLYESLDWTPVSNNVAAPVDYSLNADPTTTRLSDMVGAAGSGAGYSAADAFSSMVASASNPQTGADDDFVPEGPAEFLSNDQSNSQQDELPEPASGSDAEPAEEELPLPQAKPKIDEPEQERDEPGERSYLPSRFLAPDLTQGVFIATQYVPGAAPPQPSPQEEAASFPSATEEPPYEPAPVEKEPVPSVPSVETSDSFYKSDDPVPVETPPPAEVAAAPGASPIAVGTAFAAGAALAAARAGSAPSDNDFFSTVPGATASPVSADPAAGSEPPLPLPEMAPPPVAATVVPTTQEPPVESQPAPRSNLPPLAGNEPAPFTSELPPPSPVHMHPAAETAPLPPVPASSAPSAPHSAAASTIPPLPPAPSTALPVSSPAVSNPVVQTAPVAVAPEPISFQPQPQPTMDFFAATGGGFFSTERSTMPIMPQTASANQTILADFDASAVMGGGATASFLQRAIEAGGTATTLTVPTIEAPRDARPAEPDSTAKKKKRAEKSRSATKEKEESDDDNSKKKRNSKSGSGKSSLAASRNKGRRSRNDSEDEPESREKIAGGMSMPKKLAIGAAVLVIGVVFPVCFLLGQIGSLVGGLGAGTAPGGAGMSLTGNWQIAFRNNGSQVNGIMSLTQKGETLEGWGNDPKATFVLKGKLSKTQQGRYQVVMNKQYVDQNNQPLGKPILYAGVIDGMNPQGPYFMHISGIWKFQKAQGYSWRRQIVEYSDKWEAALTQPGAASAASSGGPQVAVTPPAHGGQTTGGGPLAMPSASDPKAAHQFFFNVAIILLAIGGAIAWMSLQMFGPSGWLNILAKQKYIPSQFKDQHAKMLREMRGAPKRGGLPIGSRVEWGWMELWMTPRILSMPPTLRESNPHCLIIGQGAKGKSRLMASMIAHDIESADRAVIVVDSDGSLVDLLMNWIASHPKGKQLSDRVIVIDPTRDGDNMCYNPLRFPDDGDLQNAASAIVFGFKAIYTEPPGSQSQWNQQTANILRNCAVLLMANNKTLTDLPVLLSDNDQRDIMLERVERLKHERTEYITLLDAWTNYKRLARTDQWINWIEPILNRVQPMLGDPRIRPILTKAEGDLDLKTAIKNKQILFVKIPQGQLDQNGNLLGSLIVTGVKQAALSLSKSKSNGRHPCALYLDEFDSFIEKETFDQITTETKKFQVGLISVAKTLQGLPEDYRNQIIANIGSMAVFALTKKDGDMLGPQMFRVDGRKMKHQTIQNFFNKVNTSPQFELISDEEKLNIDRVVAQDERTYFFYRVGSVAGVFKMRAPEFKDIAEKDINFDLVERMYDNRQEDITGDDDDDEEE